MTFFNVTEELHAHLDFDSIVKKCDHVTEVTTILGTATDEASICSHLFVPTLNQYLTTFLHVTGIASSQARIPITFLRIYDHVVEVITTIMIDLGIFLFTSYCPEVESMVDGFLACHRKIAHIVLGLQ